MRLELDGYNPIGTDIGGLDMESSSSNSGLPSPGSEKSVPSLNLTSDLSLAQQKGQAAVDLYRIWWEKYDKMTRGDEGSEGWGRMKEEGEKMSSTFMGCLIAFVFTLFCLMVMVVVICKKCKRQRAAKLLASRLSLPPPYEMVMEEKERLALETGLPSYKEACPNTS